MINVGSAVGYLMLDTSSFKDGFKSAMQDLEIFKDESAKTGDKFSALGTTMSKVGAGLTKNVTAPILGVAGTMLYFGKQSEEAFRKFQTGTGKSAEEAKAYKDVMNNVFSDNWGDSLEDVADTMTLINQQLGDMPTDQMEEVTKQALAIRDTFDIDINEGIRGVNALVKQFGIEADEAYNLIIQGAQKGLNQNQDLADQLSEYSVYYQQLGFDAEGMFAIIETGAKNGVFQIDYMNDAIKEFGIRAIDGSDTTIAAFEQLGFSAEDMANKFAAGGDTANEAFFDVIEALNDMESDVDRNAVGVALFGTKWEDLGAAAIPALEEMEGSISATTDAFGQLEEASMTDLTRELQSLAASFGELILPYALRFIDALAGMIEKIKNLPEPIKQFIIVAGGIVSAIGPVLIIIGKVISAVTTIGGLLSKGPAILGALSKAFSLLGGPITIVMTIIGALIAYFVNLYNTNEEFRNKVNAVWDAVKAKIGEVVTGIIEFFQEFITSAIELKDTVANKFEEIRDGVVESIKNVVNDVKTKWQEMIDWFKQKIADFKQIGTDIIHGIWDGITAVSDWLSDKVSGFVQGIKDKFTGKDGFDIHSPSKWAAGAMTNVIAGLGTGVDNGKENFLDKVGGFITEIKDTFKDKIGLEDEPLEIPVEIKPSEDTDEDNLLQTSLDNVINDDVSNSLGFDVMSKMAEGFWENSELFEEKIYELVELIRVTVEDSKKSLYASGFKIMQYFEQGLLAAYAVLQIKVEAIIRWLKAKLSQILSLIRQIQTAAGQLSSAGGSVSGSHKNGLSYVPYDGYVAELHEGERVLTKEENKEYSDPKKSSGGDTYNFYSPKPITPREARKQLKKAKRDMEGGYV